MKLHGIKIGLLVLAFAACQRPNPDAGTQPPSGGDDADGGAPAASTSADGGADAADGDGGVRPAPAFQAGSYGVSSSGLLAQTCADGISALPGDAVWSITTVSPGILNLVISKTDEPIVLTWNGTAYAGQLVEVGMPEANCMLQDTVTVSLTPSDLTHAGGQVGESLLAQSGSCADAEPVLPCHTINQVALTPQ
jgi:hypothetical protein